MAIYFQPARHLRAHTHAHTFSLDLDSTPSAFLTATRLLSKPIPRVGPRGSGHPPTFYRLLDTLRRRVTSSLSLSLAIALSFFLSLSLSLSFSLSLALAVVLALSLALATHWHEMNLCKGASIDFTEIVFETSCWETFGKFLGWFWMNEAKFRIECSVGGIEVGFLEEDFQFVLLTMNLKVFDQVDC